MPCVRQSGFGAHLVRLNGTPTSTVGHICNLLVIIFLLLSFEAPNYRRRGGCDWLFCHVQARCLVMSYSLSLNNCSFSVSRTPGANVCLR